MPRTVSRPRGRPAALRHVLGWGLAALALLTLALSLAAPSAGAQEQAGPATRQETGQETGQATGQAAEQESAQETAEASEEAAEETQAPPEPGGEERRIITIEAPGGTSTGNIRTGPIHFTHPQPEGVVATVATLTIYAQEATLRAPEGELINQARGRRTAEFTEGVRVVRGRLSATGPDLVYAEETGRGVLRGPAQISVSPREEDDDEVEIAAEEVDFDVDTDTSTSRGNVTLISGNSFAEAEEIVFEEERELARLRDEAGQVTIVRRGESELTITADEIRVLTADNRLLARGNVTLTSGNTTSTGDTVYFDDEAARAEIVGNPARAVNEAEGFEITGGRIEQLTDLDVVELLTGPAGFDEGEFDLSLEARP